jgi:hypothetical protein
MYRHVICNLVGLGVLVGLAGCPAEPTASRDHSNSQGPSFASGGMGGTGSDGAPGGVGGSAGVAGEGGSGGEFVTGGTGEAGGFVPPMDRVFDADRTNVNRNKVSAGALCDRLSTIQCAGEAFCCDMPGRDRAVCKEEMLMGCRAELLLDLVSSAPETGFDPALAEVAFTEFERLASTCDPGIANFGLAVDGLRGVMRGTLAHDAECTPEGYSLSSPPSNEEGAVALASCLDAATHACMPGLMDWECRARAGQGASCFTDANCKEGLFCDNPDLNLSGNECMARKAGGASCELPNECTSLACKGGKCAAPGDVQAAYCLR